MTRKFAENTHGRSGADATSISRRSFLLMAGAMTAITGGGFSQARAATESVLALHIEEQTSWVQNFNPFDLGGRRQSTMDFIYEPLVIFNPYQGGKATYRLATAHKFSDDLLALTYTIREGAKWSDGQPLTAEDVLFTFNLMLKNPALDIVGVADAVSVVELVAPSDIKLTLKAVNTLLPELLQDFPTVPQHIWKDIADPIAFHNETPVGSGPFTEIRRFTPQVYEQARNPNYWDAASLKVDVLKFPQIAGNDQMLALLPNGDLDWFGSFLPDIDKTYVALDPAHNGYWQPPAETVSFIMNMKTGKAGNAEAFNDVNFRRAFSLTLDRKSMVDIAGFGYPVANSLASGLPPKFSSWLNPDAGKDFDKWLAFDVDGANKALDDAGYDKKDADGFRLTKSGQAIAFAIMVPNGWTDWIDACQIAAEGLRKAGLNATVATPEYEQWSKQALDGSFDVYLDSRGDGSTPFSAYFNSLASQNAGRTTEAGARYSNPDLDKLFAEFQASADDGERHAIFGKVQALVAQEMPVVPAYNGPTWYQFSTKRFTGFVTKDTPTMNPENHDNNRMRLMHLLQLTPVA